MSRAEHLRWAKDRALEYVEAGDLVNAQASMTSDLSKHPETRGHRALHVWMLLALGGRMDTAEEVRQFVEAIN